MKNSPFSKCKTPLKNIPAMRILVIASLLFFSSQADLLHAQDAKLSVQGILKKASGEAVPDGSYSLTFRLYTSPTAPVNQNIWMETQNAVDVVSGIYSTVLGNTEPLDVAFDTDYYLGVTVGSTEMTPRIELTSAPYALSIRGEKNKFPSSGAVIADSIRVNGGVLARGGAPGANGTNKNGFAFTTNNGDKDSGLFSLGNGQVSLHVNSLEEVKVTPDSMVINSEVRPQSIRLDNGGKVSYNGLDDWRLVETDYFENGVEDWKEYDPSNDVLGWNTSTNDGDPAIAGVNNHFAGRYIKPNEQNQVLKKEFNLSNVGTYNFIKVKFKYYYLDAWDGQNEGDASFAAIAETATGTGMRIGYTMRHNTTNYSGDFNTTLFQNANKWGGAASTSDFTENAEMTFFKCNSCNNIFWLMFGASLNTDNTGNMEEAFGVGMIEIWVK